jgi:16S rRNA (uracil1498-N3)-methyltransferase
VKTQLAPGSTVELDAGQANYLGNVMRMGVGGEALLFDGENGEWLARITEAGKKRMTLVTDQPGRLQESVPDLELAFAPVKRSQTDWLVEKTTELGIAVLQPVVTARTIVERVKLERLNGIAIEAAEQCNRTSLPVIAEPMSLTTFLKGRDPARHFYFADEKGGSPGMMAFIPGPATILTGPEGGFTDEERRAIRATDGCTAISLGPRILRAETAALAAVTLWMAAVGDWR